MTDEKTKRPGTFQKGKGRKRDPRINTKGRPNYFDDLRRMVIDILGETVESKTRKITRLENILREWIDSGDFAKQARLLEIAWGKIPDITHTTNEIEDFIIKNMDLLTDGQLVRLSNGKATPMEILRELLEDIAQAKN